MKYVGRIVSFEHVSMIEIKKILSPHCDGDKFLAKVTSKASPCNRSTIKVVLKFSSRLKDKIQGTPKYTQGLLSHYVVHTLENLESLAVKTALVGFKPRMLSFFSVVRQYDGNLTNVTPFISASDVRFQDSFYFCLKLSCCHFMYLKINSNCIFWMLTPSISESIIDGPLLVLS